LELRQEAIDDEEYEVAVSIKKVLDTINLEERVDWIALIHKQNLNGRETEDELFEAGILAGIEETKEIMYSEEDMRNAFEWGANHLTFEEFIEKNIKIKNGNNKN